ncbi:hypothetical protein K7X08_002208 [Anisodus acutangulus]|uniref:Uncharacterized protein n=1 Tax=Anisodus acutangulus TaxID=402998 RepID=A0A9Q1LSI2_9SOLA|nr:hypothetical protein K7X08_002208 [Anisodus acutangulus]
MSFQSDTSFFDGCLVAVSEGIAIFSVVSRDSRVVRLVHGLVDEVSMRPDIARDLHRQVLEAGYILAGYGRQGRDQVGIDNKVEDFGRMGNNRKVKTLVVLIVVGRFGVMAFGRLTFDLAYVSTVTTEDTPSLFLLSLPSNESDWIVSLVACNAIKFVILPARFPLL